jgi:hypothetical protein
MGDRASLYSDRRQSNFTAQARHYGALVRRAEQVTRSEGARMTFGAKLDGLETRNTAASRT